MLKVSILSKIFAVALILFVAMDIVFSALVLDVAALPDEVSNKRDAWNLRRKRIRENRLKTKRIRDKRSRTRAERAPGPRMRSIRNYLPRRDAVAYILRRYIFINTFGGRGKSQDR